MPLKKLFLSLVILLLGSPSLAAPPAARIVAIGDLHGDLDNAVDVLRLAGVLNERLSWIGGNTVLIQTGDITDRGADSKDLMDLMRRLQREAAEAGGQVIPLLGNHEVMNTQGDWRYVHPNDTAKFGGAEVRKEAFSSNGEYGQWLASLDTVVLVNGTVFVHGGIIPRVALLGIEGINEGVRAELFERQGPISGENGPLWFRGFAQLNDEIACGVLDETLRHLKANRMVVGHTTQRTGSILSRCNGKLAVIDIGISDHYGAHYGYWESQNGDSRAVYPSKTVDLPDP